MKIAKTLQNKQNQSKSENPWTPLFDSIYKFSDDFMNERKQPQKKRQKNNFDECSN